MIDLATLHPTDHGQYLIIDCPKCGHHEAYIYKVELEKAKKNPRQKIHYTCNRQNHCGARGVLDDVSLNSVKMKPVQDFKIGLSEESLKKLDLLYRLNDRIVGFDFDIRGISNTVLKENKVCYYPYGFSELIATSGGMDDKKYQWSVYKERNIFFPILNEKEKIVRILLRSTKPQEKKEIQLKTVKNNATEIWNLKDVLDENIQVLFLCEGCYDALSVKEAAKQLGRSDIGAISIPGCRKIKKIIKELNSFNSKRLYVIATDSDEAGIEAVKTARLEFLKAGKPSKVFNLNGFKDVNDFLLGNKKLFLKEISRY